MFAPREDLTKDYSEVYSVLDTYYNEQEAKRKGITRTIPQQYEKEVWTNPLHYSGLKQYNKNYQLIIDLYKKGSLKSAKEEIIKEFGQREWNSAIGIDIKDKIIGFVVAAHFGNHQFDEAAKLILERDKALPRWNHSLKLDLIKVIRNYRIAKGLPAAINLVDSLKVNYDSEIISYFWTSTPFVAAYTIEKGTHETWTSQEVVGETKNNLEYLLETYQNDPYCSYGYYLLGDSRKAIECNPKTRMIDILHYSVGIYITDTLFSKYSHDLPTKKLSFYSSRKISNKSDIDKINEAIFHFRTYIENFETSQYADDAAFWIGWLNMLIRNKEEALYWFGKTNTLGDKGYEEISLAYKSIHLSEFSERLIISDLENSFLSQQQLNQTSDNSNSPISFYHVEAFEKLSFNEKIKFLQRNPIRTERLFFAYIDKMVKISEYNEAYILFEEIGKNPSLFLNLISNDLRGKIDDLEEMIYWYVEIVEETDVEIFISKVIKTKNQLELPKLALTCLRKKREEKNWVLKQDYFDYLIIKILADVARNEVESEVIKFEANHNESEFLDDVLAELALVQLFKLKEPQNGIKTVKKIVDEHTNDNACDNALNWLGKYYFNECIRRVYWRNEITFCYHSLETNQLITENYWFSTYKKVSKYRAEETERIIENFNPNSRNNDNLVRDLWREL